MTRRGPLWRTILWCERFLPAPRDVSAAPQPAKRSRWVLLFALLPAPLGVLISRRSEGLLLPAHWWPAMLALSIVVVLATLAAAVGFGVKAWRDAHHA